MCFNKRAWTPVILVWICVGLLVSISRVSWHSRAPVGCLFIYLILYSNTLKESRWDLYLPFFKRYKNKHIHVEPGQTHRKRDQSYLLSVFEWDERFRFQSFSAVHSHQQKPVLTSSVWACGSAETAEVMRLIDKSHKMQFVKEGRPTFFFLL